MKQAFYLPVILVLLFSLGMAQSEVLIDKLPNQSLKSVARYDCCQKDLCLMPDKVARLMLEKSDCSCKKHQSKPLIEAVLTYTPSFQVKCIKPLSVSSFCVTDNKFFFEKTIVVKNHCDFKSFVIYKHNRCQAFLGIFII